MRILLTAVVLIALAGCSSDAPTPTEPSGPTTILTAAMEPPKQPLPLPDFQHTSNLGILKGQDTLKVGMSVEDALAIFAEPRGSYEKSERPPAIPEPYEIRGWQASDQGFGLVAYQGRVVAAMHQMEGVTPDRLEELAQRYRSEYGPAKVFIPGDFARYWIWDNQEPGRPADHILLVSASQTHPNRFFVTEAIGWQPIMQALGMIPETAARDARIANKMAEDRAKSQKPANQKGG